ncbi:MAG: hypothetical protein IT561_23480 [Alphaproteobacteria bacterium]|nr:hypothetical protein [Alphaproteobacteria bacterium]
MTLPAGTARRVGSPPRPEVIAILRFIVRVLAFAAIVLWTLLMVGAFQALVETGRILGALEIELGMPELEAAVLNLMLLLERAGPVGIIAGWLVGVLAILIVRAILLRIIGLAWRSTSTWARPAPPPARPLPAAGRSQGAPPARPAAPLPGPWGRAPAPAALPPPPAAATGRSLPPPAGYERAATPPTTASVVDRSFRLERLQRRGGTVVLQRPRGHMERS